MTLCQLTTPGPGFSSLCVCVSCMAACGIGSNYEAGARIKNRKAGIASKYSKSKLPFQRRHFWKQHERTHTHTHTRIPILATCAHLTKRFPSAQLRPGLCNSCNSCVLLMLKWPLGDLRAASATLAQLWALEAPVKESSDRCCNL